jgi:hypothetical protein
VEAAVRRPLTAADLPGHACQSVRCAAHGVGEGAPGEGLADVTVGVPGAEDGVAGTTVDVPGAAVVVPGTELEVADAGVVVVPGVVLAVGAGLPL